MRRRLNEASKPSILGRLGQIAFGHWRTRQAPTTTQRRSLEIAEGDFTRVAGDLARTLGTDLPDLEAELEAAGAPWTPGRKLPQPASG